MSRRRRLDLGYVFLALQPFVLIGLALPGLAWTIVTAAISALILRMWNIRAIRSATRANVHR